MAIETNPGFEQSLTYSAEITRRSIFSPMLDRGSSVGSVVGGLIGSGDFLVTVTSGQNLSVAAGEAICPGSSSGSQSGYYVRGSSATSITASANQSSPRVDLVYLQVNDATYTGSTNNATCAIANGTPTGGANLTNLNGAPSLPTSALALAYTLTPATSGATTVSNVGTIIRPANYPAPGTLLASLSYVGGSDTNYVAATTLTALDTTNLRLTATVPQSGKVRLRASAFTASAVHPGYMGFLNGATTLAVGEVNNGVTAARVPFESLVTGLAAGTSINFDLAASCASGGTLNVYYGPTNGPIDFSITAA